jgi:Uncharacterized protein conserved in archaea
MNRPFLSLPLCACLLLAGGSSLAEGANEAAKVDSASRQILGWVENMRLMPGRALLKAKLDSGAKSSALHAEDIEYFEQDGRQMVRFTVRENHRDKNSERFIYERPLVREVAIKLRRTEQRDERPAVRLEFCMAGRMHETLFTLTDRTNFNYPVLLGRDFLQHGIVVDSSTTFTQRTRCPRS